MQLENAPLVHVLVQVVFSPVWDIQERVTPFGRALQELDFPWVEPRQIHNVTVTDNAPPRVEIKERWDFLNPDRTTAVSLMDSMLVLQTATYTSGEPFRRQLQDILQVLATVAEVGFVERIGLRYIDVVRVRPGERFSEYVKPGLLAFPWREAEGLGARAFGIRTESLAHTAIGGVMGVRSSVLQPGQILPADLMPPILLYPAVPEAVAPLPALALDFDHYITFDQSPFAFHPDQIVGVVRDLHAGHRAAFGAATTAHAIECWGPVIEEEELA